ncbi:MAG: hypothetical protein AAF830_09280 [Pseudomonadota bacterium]
MDRQRWKWPVATFFCVFGTAQAANGPTVEQVNQALRETARYVSEVLITDSGAGLSDYHIRTSSWDEYETHWHTGQLICALVEAYEATGDKRMLDAAEKAGNWWVSTEYQSPHPFAGLVDAAHGNRLGRLINWTTISDGTPGLFRLSEVTGNATYADAATRSGRWLWENTRVPDTVEGGEGLFYNLFDPKTGEVLRDWNAHIRGIERDPAKVDQEGPSPVTEVARPNIEGFLFADMCQHTREEVWCERFLEQADHALSRQHPNGLWMDFEPNDLKTGSVHPRFNIWNAEALVEAYKIAGDRKYIEGAAKTARFFRDATESDGTIYYRSYIDGPPERTGITGSAVAFSGLLMIELKRADFDEFDEAIDRAARWIVTNRFSSDHPDPNLAGAVINTRTKVRGRGIQLINRDVGTTFGIRFLAAYAELLESRE